MAKKSKSTTKKSTAKKTMGRKAMKGAKGGALTSSYLKLKI